MSGQDSLVLLCIVGWIHFGQWVGVGLTWLAGDVDPPAEGVGDYIMCFVAAATWPLLVIMLLCTPTWRQAVYDHWRKKPISTA